MLPHRYRIYLLLGASYYFYMSWRWEFGFLMAFVSVLNYATGAKIALVKNKVGWLSVAIVGSMMPLVYYKYGNFLLQQIGYVGNLMGAQPNLPLLDVILPVGI
jgi:alginate O-acetyltransferase complex protein AlgI